MLCKKNPYGFSCEDRFAHWENKFRHGLWPNLLKAVRGHEMTLTYDASFCRFAESLIWRSLLAHADLSLPECFQAACKLQDALQQDKVSEATVEMYVLLPSHEVLKRGNLLSSKC